MSIDHARLLSAQANALRKAADAIDAQARMLEEEFIGLPAEQLLRGRAIADAAVVVLAVADPAQGMHYRELLTRVEAATGKFVAGAKPSATLLSALHRDQRVTTGADRSGLVRLAAGEGER